MEPYEKLSWDSAFFGFPVARLPPDCSEQELAGVLQQMRGCVRLAYWFPPMTRGAQAIVRRLRGTPAGVQVRYELNVDANSEARDEAIAIHSATPAMHAHLTPLAHSAGAGSRFASDSRMPSGTVQRMYDLWLHRSLAGEIADVVLLASHPRAQPAGFASLAAVGASATIGLVAVAEAARRRGVGRALMGAIKNEALRRGVSLLKVSTQERNSAACRLYTACGFSVVHRNLAVHFWL